MICAQKKSLSLKLGYGQGILTKGAGMAIVVILLVLGLFGSWELVSTADSFPQVFVALYGLVNEDYGAEA